MQYKISNEVKKTALLCGNQLEVSIYRQPQAYIDNVKYNVFDNLSDRRKEKSDKDKIKALLINGRKRKTKIRRIIKCNESYSFAKRPKFLTLTFKDCPTYEEASHCFDVFMKRLRYKYPKLKYLCKLELQKRGSIHYHIVLFDTPFIDIQYIKKHWDNKYGSSNIEAIRSSRGMAFYISKYIEKQHDKDGNIIVDIRLYGKRTLYVSQNCLRPIKLNDKLINTKDYKCIYSSDEWNFNIYILIDEQIKQYKFNKYCNDIDNFGKQMQLSIDIL